MAFQLALKDYGFKFVFLVRLCPLFPFNINNYIIGLTDISTKDNIYGLVGVIPSICSEVYVGT